MVEDGKENFDLCDLHETSSLQKKTVQPVVVYKVEEAEIKKVEIEKNVFLRIIQTSDDKYIDIRKYYKGYPTKKGIRFKTKVFNLIKKIIEEDL